MIRKKIYLLRHGQTDFNYQKIAQGSGINSSLNSTGIHQALVFFEKYKDVKFDKIYTSALVRTVETVKPYLEMGVQHRPVEGLNEINWGAREGTTMDDCTGSYYHEVITAWRRGDLHYKIEKGESPEDVAIRLKTAIKVILENQEEETILICMHGRAMRILLCILLNYPLTCMDYFPHENTSLYQLIYTGSMVRMAMFNDLSHLSNEEG